MLTYECVRSRVAMRAELCKSRSPERLSLCPCAPAPFPHKVSSLRCGTLRGPRILPHKVSSLRCGTLWGPRKQGLFRALHRNIPPQRTGVGAGALDPYAHLFEDVFELHVHSFGVCLNFTCTHSEWSLTPTYSFSKTVSRAAQPNLHSGRLRPLLQVAARICDLAS